jgi:hypothetical protein
MKSRQSWSDRLAIIRAIRAVRYASLAAQLRPESEAQQLRRRKVHLRSGYLARRYR